MQQQGIEKAQVRWRDKEMEFGVMGSCYIQGYVAGCFFFFYSSPTDLEEKFHVLGKHAFHCLGES